MDIRTLWERPDRDEDMPWLAAVDEYTIEEHNGLPEFYTKEMKPNRRELIIHIEESAVQRIFTVQKAKGTPK